ncbi:MAG: hypothetical protein EHM12_10900 [Dehalococcoidia bacterium]|nr:MAG: hypothetical protein EHM12_10900 [Dehalococcoidia bacterium]
MKEIIIPPNEPLFNKVCLLLEDKCWHELTEFVAALPKTRTVKLDFWQFLKYLDRHAFCIEVGCTYRKKIMGMVEYPYLSDKRPTHLKLVDGWGLRFEKDGSLVFFEKEKNGGEKQ